MLPEKLRFDLFDRLSIQTMRYVKSVPRKEAKGLTKEVYDMIADDFFINGSLTSHSKVPELMAGVWTGGRESMLVDDILDRTTKEAMTGVVSNMNSCAYCGDMLVSLVFAADKHNEAKNLYSNQLELIEDSALREKLVWTRDILTKPGAEDLPLPFSRRALPEVVAAILSISHINRFSHIVMDGSPVKPVLGSDQIKKLGLRVFGSELKSTKVKPLLPDRTDGLLPQAPLPEDMAWARENPRIARALARWAGVIQRESVKVVPAQIIEMVGENLSHWDGTDMPISRSWVEDETRDLTGEMRDLARFSLIVAKSAPQIDEDLIHRVHKNEEQFIRLLAWASFSGARRVAANVATKTNMQELAKAS